MSAFSDYMENALIDWILRGQAAPTLPAALHVGLFTAAPSDSGGGTEVSTSGTGYSRQSFTRALTAFNATQGGTAGASNASNAAGNSSSNAAAITFNGGNVTTGAWGTVTHFGIFDASTGGNLLLHAPLTASRVINSGDGPVRFDIGTLTLTLA